MTPRNRIRHECQNEERERYLEYNNYNSVIKCKILINATLGLIETLEKKYVICTLKNETILYSRVSEE